MVPLQELISDNEGLHFLLQPLEMMLTLKIKQSAIVWMDKGFIMRGFIGLQSGQTQAIPSVLLAIYEIRKAIDVPC